MQLSHPIQLMLVLTGIVPLGAAEPASRSEPAHAENTKWRDSPVVLSAVGGVRLRTPYHFDEPTAGVTGWRTSLRASIGNPQSSIRDALGDMVWADHTPPPGPRRNHAMAYDDARNVTVLFGGLDDNDTSLGDTWEWNGSEWDLVSTNGPAPRSGHRMAYDNVRRVTVLFGGGDDTYLGDTWEWDGAAWTLMSTNGPSPRWLHAMSFDSARGVTVLFGGNDSAPGYLNDVWEWSGNNWTQIAGTGPTPRIWHDMTYDDTRSVSVMFGGFDGSAELGDTWEWDGSNWAQASTTGPSSRGHHALAFDSASGVCVLFGGYDSNQVQGDTWEWDGSTWTLVATTGPSPRWYHAMVYDSAEAVTMLLGGSDSSGLQGDTWEWNASTWTQALNTSPGARGAHAMAYDSSRDLTVLFGGLGDGIRQDTWEWDGLSWTMITTNGPNRRYAHAMAYDSSRNRATLFGGIDIGTSSVVFLRDTWEWDGANWTLMSTNGPDSRGYHAMAYDSGRGVTVLFGGYYWDGTLHGYGDTWEWDGNAWSLVSTNGPTPRDGHAMAYDPARDVTVLFGGTDGSQFLGDTWEWDGSTWMVMSSNGPSPRAGHAMAYDATSESVVLFGGTFFDGAYHDYGDTWAWDGSAWALLSTSGPTPRSLHAMVYDQSRSRAVLFGGLENENFGAPLRDTWELGQDCNENGILDLDDIAAGSSTDCNGNAIPDECDLYAGTSMDCNSNGVSDECEWRDCNSNGVPDECDIWSGYSLDCNSNGIPDVCDLVDPSLRWPAALNSNAPSDNGESDYLPTIATDGQGTWLAAWSSTDDHAGIGTDLDILFSRSADDGVTWSVTQALNSTAGSDEPSALDVLPQFATDGAGNWLVIWSSTNDLGGAIGTDFDLLYAWSADNAASWSDPLPFNANAGLDDGDDIMYGLITSGQRWVAVWYSTEDLNGQLGTDYDILYSLSMDGGQTWSAPGPLNNNAATDSGDDYRPALATDGVGNWIAVWHSEDDLGGTIGVDRDILFARSAGDATTWTDPLPLNSDATTDNKWDFSAQVSTDQAGVWIAAWVTDPDQAGPPFTDSNVMYIRSLDQGATWSIPKSLTNLVTYDGQTGEAPALAADAQGKWVLLWPSAGDLGIGDDTDIMLSHSVDDGMTWSPPLPLNANAGSDAGDDGEPRLITDGQGRWVAAWESQDDLGGVIGNDLDVLVADFAFPPNADCNENGVPDWCDAGDYDGDGDINLADFANFDECLGGPAAGLTPCCATFDFDGDSDVDLGDFAGFQAVFSAP